MANYSEEIDPFNMCTFFAIELSAINGAIELRVLFLKQGLELLDFARMLEGGVDKGKTAN